MNGLRISEDLSLPLEAVTQTFGILAKRGVGKTYTAAVMAEEMLKARLQVVIVDPVGAWWGLRSSADGRGPGLPIAVLGGDHGDLPLQPADGAAIADLAVDEAVSVLLDLSLFRKGEAIRFMEAFAETLYHRNRSPLHLVLDEADAYAPQRPMPGQQRLLGAVEDLVRRGRGRGIGVTLISQRPAVLNKDVLTQVEVLVALRLIAPQDRSAVDEWVKVHGEPGQREELMRSLPSLPIGTGWFWSPGWLDLFKRVQIRRRETFDSSATPKVGQRLREPRTLADVDVEALKTRLASSIEKAKAENPRELRRQLVDLNQKLQGVEATNRLLVKASEQRKVQEVVKEIRVPVLEEAELEALRVVADQLASGAALVAEAAEKLHASLAGYSRRPAPHRSKFEEAIAQPIPLEKLREANPHLLDLIGDSSPSVVPPVVSPTGRPTGPERKVLTVLARYPEGAGKTKTALLAQYSARGGGFNNTLSSLRTKGWIEGRGDLQITEAGLAALGNDWEPLPTGPDLVEYWIRSLGKAEAAILRALVEAYPAARTKQELGGITGYEPTGGGFNNACSRLRTLELVSGYGSLRAADVLGEAMAGAAPRDGHR